MKHNLFFHLLIFSICQLISPTKGFPSDWQWMSPLPQGENLYSIWKNTPSDIYAVGDFGTIIHFDGRQWTEIEHKIFTGRLTALWSDSITTYLGGTNGSVLSLTGNGPINIGPGGGLSFSRVWKLGQTLYGLHSSGLKKLEANSWTDIQVPVVTQYTDLWGDGDTLFVSGKGGFLQTYDSSTNKWTDLIFPGSGIDIYSLWGNADTIIISGSQGNVWKYDRANKTWLNISPNSGDLFLGVWFDSIENIFIASQSNLGRFNGSTWTFFTSNGFFQDLHGGIAVGWHGRIFAYDNNWAPMQPKYNTDTYKAKAIGDNIYAAGWEGRSYKYNKEFQIFEETQTNCAGIYRDVWGVSEDNIVMVGTRGNICHFFDNGTGFPEWHHQTVFPPVSTKFGPALNGVWGNNQQNIFAVGDNKSIFYFNGIEWVQQLEELSGPTLEGIWGNSPSNIYAVGTGGLILHFDGSNWNQMASPTTNNLTSVWGFSSDNIYIVGAGGTILNFDGQQWQRVDTKLAISPSFLSVWGVNGNIFAGGYNGIVLLFNGNFWKQLDTGTSFPFLSIYGIDGRTIIGTSGNGNEGAAWRYTGPLIPILTGDADANGKLNLQDAMSIVNAMVNNNSGIMPSKNDLNGTGKYGLPDLQYILRTLGK